MILPKIQLAQKSTYKKFAEDVDFFALFQKIEQEFETCFIFESLGEEGSFSRYSIIGFDPQYIISARKNQLTVDNKTYTVANPYFALRDMMPQQSMSKEYSGGLVGYLSYEAVNYMEPAVNVKIHDKFPQFTFGVYTDGLVLDKLTNELLYFYYDNDRSDILQALLKNQIKQSGVNVAFLKDGLTQREHAKIVEEVKEQIKSGNTFQCEVGFKSEYKITGNAIKIYERLRDINPSPFMYYLKFAPSANLRLQSRSESMSSGSTTKIIGASPELLFSLRDGEMTTRPLAGTIQRGSNEQEDQLLARKLLYDEKELAEHKMLIDLQRNDIGKVAQVGTVKVRNLLTIKKFSHVQHISSEIGGIIDSGHDMFCGLAHNFPMGTVTGTPKVETMKIIDKNEQGARGPYGGGVGQFGFNGDCTFALTLRSLFIVDTYAYTQTCSGIVYDSDAEKEYEEVQHKLAAMRKVLSL